MTVNLFTSPLNDFKNLLAKSTYFQNYVDIKDETECKKKIFIIYTNEHEDRPFAILTTGDVSMVKIGEPFSYSTTGSFNIIFEQDATKYGDTEKDIIEGFTQEISDIILDISAIATASSTFGIKSIDTVKGIYRTAEEHIHSEGNNVATELKVTY